MARSLNLRIIPREAVVSGTQLTRPIRFLAKSPMALWLPTRLIGLPICWIFDKAHKTENSYFVVAALNF